MNEQPATTERNEDEEIEQLLLEFNGDYRAALRAVLHDLEVLARDHGKDVSRGYVRGHMWHFNAQSKIRQNG
jgi:hypothetical protein